MYGNPIITKRSNLMLILKFINMLVQYPFIPHLSLTHAYKSHSKCDTSPSLLPSSMGVLKPIQVSQTLALVFPTLRMH